MRFKYLFYIHSEDNEHNISYQRRWTPLDTVQIISNLKNLKNIECRITYNINDLLTAQDTTIILNTTSLESWQCPRPQLTKLIHISKSIDPSNDILLTGYHGTIATEYLAKKINCNYIIKSNPEHILFDYITGKEISQNKNVLQIKPQSIKRPKIDNIEYRKQVLDFTSLDPKDYKFEAMNWNKVLTYEHSSGCTYNCYFCAKDIMYGKDISYNTIDHTISSIKNAKATGFEKIYFNDLRISENLNELKNLCQALIDNNINMHWGCEPKIDDLNEDIIVLMYKAGCRYLAIGIENFDFSQESKKFTNNFSLNDAYSLIRFAEKKGIKTLSYFMYTDNRFENLKTFYNALFCPSTFINITEMTYVKNKKWFIESIEGRTKSKYKVEITLSLLICYLNPIRWISIFKIFGFKNILKPLNFFYKVRLNKGEKA